MNLPYKTLISFSFSLCLCYLTNLDELLLRIVCALPNDSSIGFACSIWCWSWFACLSIDATSVKYWITFLVFSVFPAPDSPLFFFNNILTFPVFHYQQSLRDQDGLIFSILDHVMIGLICNRVDMRRHFTPSSAFIRWMYSSVYIERFL